MRGLKGFPLPGSSSPKKPTPDLRSKVHIKLKHLKETFRLPSRMEVAGAALAVTSAAVDTIKAVIKAIQNYRGAEEDMLTMHMRLEQYLARLEDICKLLHKIAPGLNPTDEDKLHKSGAGVHERCEKLLALVEKRAGDGNGLHIAKLDKAIFAVKDKSRLIHMMENLEGETNRFKDYVEHFEALQRETSPVPVADIAPGGKF